MTGVASGSRAGEEGRAEGGRRRDGGGAGGSGAGVEALARQGRGAGAYEGGAEIRGSVVVNAVPVLRGDGWHVGKRLRWWGP